jgi:hypothetical protein
MILALAAALCVAPAPLRAVTITLDYSYDTGFFGPGTAARTSLEAAAGLYSNILSDTLAAIQPPPPTFTGTGGTVRWNWTLTTNHPSGAGMLSFANGAVAQDQVIIFPGAKTYAGNTLAIGSPAGAQISRTGPALSAFKSYEVTQINAMQSQLAATVFDRGEESGFATWGGTISFDADSNWHVNHLTPTPPGKFDLYTVAIHELAHAFGIGSTSDWTGLVSGSNFVGAAAMSAYGGPVPLTDDRAHWRPGTGSTVFGGAATQVALMTPDLTAGVRRQLTALDAAALADIGWNVSLPPNPLPGDYNRDGTVNASDYTVWRNTLGQGVNLAADGDGNQWIDAADLAVWKTHFGETVGGGASNALDEASAVVPEPTTVVILFAGILTFFCPRRLAKR